MFSMQVTYFPGELVKAIVKFVFFLLYVICVLSENIIDEIAFVKLSKNIW